MTNTRKMTLQEYDEDLLAEYEKLHEAVPYMRAELRDDPEGCFGGRGNNSGSEILRNAEHRLAYLTGQGYMRHTETYIAILNAGNDLTPLVKLTGKDEALFISCEPGYGRKVVFKGGQTAEGNWKYTRGQGWLKGEPSAEVLEATQAVAEHLGSNLLEWRGEFYCPRVYI